MNLKDPSLLSLPIWISLFASLYTTSCLISRLFLVSYALHLNSSLVFTFHLVYCVSRIVSHLCVSCMLCLSPHLSPLYVLYITSFTLSLALCLMHLLSHLLHLHVLCIVFLALSLAFACFVRCISCLISGFLSCALHFSPCL